MDVLISEVAGEGRWSQFNLKLDWVKMFFGSPPEELNMVSLCSLNSNGNIGSKYDQRAIFKQNSRNWAFEIPDANELDYPGIQERPILALSQRLDNLFSFELLMPADQAYESVSDFLKKNRSTPERELSRVITTRQALGANLCGLNI